MSFEDLDTFYNSLVDKERKSAAEPPKPMLLVVDDDPQLREALRLALQPSYRVQLNSTARDAVAAICDELSAVILDTRMPDQDGFATYKEITERDPDLPIIFYSAYQDLKDPYEIMNQYRPFGYITKGDGHLALFRTISAAVAQRIRNTRHRTLRKELSEVREQMNALRRRLPAK